MHHTPVPIVALDFSEFDDAMTIVQRLDKECRYYKVGSELFTAEGPRVVQALRNRGCRVFLDLKFHDIPNTVKKAAAAAATLGASLITVHASGGEAMIKAAVEGAGHKCDVLGVTILTSLDQPSLAAAWGKPGTDVTDEVIRLAETVRWAGAAGVVCSGVEALVLRAHLGKDFALLVPGIRLPDSPADDQSRTVTPKQAAEAGATYMILGRTVTKAQDPVAAFRAAVA